LLVDETTFTASMMSISPFVGQFEGSDIQRAGQVPHPIGVCLISKRKSPSLYWVLDVKRTEKRPVDALAEGNQRGGQGGNGG